MTSPFFASNTRCIMIGYYYARRLTVMLIGVILIFIGWIYGNNLMEVIGTLCCLASLAGITKVIVDDTERR